MCRLGCLGFVSMRVATLTPPGWHRTAYSEIARRARVGHKIPGIARVYEHVTPEMLQQQSDVLETRWLTAAVALTEDELAMPVYWVPQLRSAIDTARRSHQVASGPAMISQFSPTTI
jgi:hypothetical protein